MNDVERRQTAQDPRRFTMTSHDLPDADDMAASQIRDAMNRLVEDTSSYPRYPWEELEDAAGLMVPEDLILVAGRTANGKTLFLTNLFDGLIDDGRRCLYIGLEQSPQNLRIKWACLRAGVHPRLILAPREHELALRTHADAVERVRAELAWQREPEQRESAFFSATRFVDQTRLRQWTEWAVDRGCEIVIVDHVDRIRHGSGKNSFHEMSETVRLAKELAVKHRIVMLMASQVGRPADKLMRYTPPGLEELRGGGTKAEEADTVLVVYRPVKAGTKQADFTAVRLGTREEASLYEPNVMAVRIPKHRLDGADAIGKTVLLNVVNGRVASRPIRQDGRYAV